MADLSSIILPNNITYNFADSAVRESLNGKQDIFLSGQIDDSSGDDYLTPSQVFSALEGGRNARVSHTDSTYGVLTFTAWNIASSAGVIVSNSILEYNGTLVSYTLYGDIDGLWTTSVALLATSTDISAVGFSGDYSDLINAPSYTATGLSASKTITALSQTDGVISATASDIAIAGSQVKSKVSSASNADVATKLGTATVGSTQRPIYLNAGTPTVMNPGEAFLSWGGQNISGNFGPLDASLISQLGANRLFGIKAAGVEITYSTDSGATWTDYGATDGVKISLFTTYAGVKLGGPSATAGNITAANQLRITIDGVDGGVYTQLRKIAMLISTNGSSGCTVTMESYDYNSSTEWHSIIQDQAIIGWSGWNILNFSLPGTGAFGGSNSATHQRKIRFTFKNTSCSTSYSGLQIGSIYAFGGVGWATPSTMASTGHLYNYDWGQNATFPARVTATELKGLGANYYGTCDTAAATATKVVTCTGFVLSAGARISVKFTNGSTSSTTMQLNVNGTGAKNCGTYIYNGTWQSEPFRCEKNEVLEFIYNGTYWVALTPYYLRNYGTYASRLTSANRSNQNMGLEYFLATSSMTTGKPPTGNAAILNMNWDNGSVYGAQLAVGVSVSSATTPGRIFSRGQSGSSTWSDWKEVPRLSGALTNGQIVVSDESTGQALLKGGPALDANDTTKFLRHDGTWQVPSAGLPSVTSADNGKVLMVVNGAWAVASLPLYDGSVT